MREERISGRPGICGGSQRGARVMLTEKNWTEGAGARAVGASRREYEADNRSKGDQT